MAGLNLKKHEDLNGVLHWVTLLPEVGDPILTSRESVLRIMREAAALEVQAQEKSNAAYQAALLLEGKIREMWGDEEISAAKSKAASY